MKISNRNSRTLTLVGEMKNSLKRPNSRIMAGKDSISEPEDEVHTTSMKKMFKKEP